MSGSPEFRPGKVLTDKQNEKVSSLASAIRCLFSPHTHRFFLSPISRLLLPALPHPPSSISPPSCLIPHLAIIYLRLQMPSLSSPIILHLPNFSPVLPLCSIFDIYFPPFIASPLLEHHLYPFLPFFNHTFGPFHLTLIPNRMCVRD